MIKSLTSTAAPDRGDRQDPGERNFRRLTLASILVLSSIGLGFASTPATAGGATAGQSAKPGNAAETVTRPSPDDASAHRGNANRLIESRNPYLLLHAYNPVDWYPWGPEAVERARKEDKPIFLSVGYSTCYWCHVAERTLYADPKIAALMNEHFINVKVDREQRPDVDVIYMRARQVLAGSGGWPNNVFLTPDLKAFFAGSYFPPNDTPGRGPGFPKVIAAISNAWTNERDKVLSTAERVHEQLQRMQKLTNDLGKAPIEPQKWVHDGARAILRSYDPVNGGFGSTRSRSRFPRAPMLTLLLSAYGSDANGNVLTALTGTLDALAQGGIYDHVGGGFHRYSTDPEWSVPHFEKMLYDNAQLVRVYAEAYRMTGRGLYKHVTADTAQFMVRDLTDPDGGFYTALDAEVDGVEGVTYVWTPSQIEAGMDEAHLARFWSLYQLSPMPRNPAHDHDPTGGVIRIDRKRLDPVAPPGTLAAIRALSTARAQLRAARAKRPQPRRDEKVLVGLNGMAIEGFAVASAALGDATLLGLAERAGVRILRDGFDRTTGNLVHEIFQGHPQGVGDLNDYAAFATGLLALHTATGKRHWKGDAIAVAEAMVSRFQTADGGFRTVPADALVPFIPLDQGDNDFPSGTSAALALLGRLAELKLPQFDEPFQKFARYLSGRLANGPVRWAAATSSVTGAGTAWASLMTPASMTPGTPGTPGSAQVISTTAATKAKKTATLRSEDKVEISVSRDNDIVAVDLEIAPGFHLNANPASLDFLVPTELILEGQSGKVTYPASVALRAEFAPNGLAVYEGQIRIKTQLEPQQATVKGTLRIQACSAEVCLPPAVVQITAR